MRSGQAGNVQGCLVRLYANPDLSGIPVRETTSTLGDSLAAKSEFEITGLPTGSYYVLSWKDYSHDALIDNLDLIGVHGDTYSRGHGGTPVVVREGQISDSADVEMGVFHELVLTITPTRRADTLDFVYSLNNTCNLDTWLLYTPWGARIEDGSQKGAKLAGTLYHAPVIGVQGQPPPGGQYAVLATGTWLLGNFRDSVVKDVGTVK